MSSDRTEIDGLMQQIETSWEYWDSLFTRLDKKSWKNKHGKDWIFEDIPFHLAYCERDLVAYPIEQGIDIPLEKQLHAKTYRDVNTWNDSFFEKRPADQAIEQTLAELEDARNWVRRTTAQFSDVDLDRKVWHPLTDMRGWQSLRFILQWSVMHNISEFLVMRSYMNLEEPIPTPEITRTTSQVMMARMPYQINREIEIETPFSFTIELTDPGAITRTISLNNGKTECTEGILLPCDFKLTLSMATFFIVSEGITSITKCISNKQIKLEGQHYLDTYNKLMSFRGLDFPSEPMPER